MARFGLLGRVRTTAALAVGGMLLLAACGGTPERPAAEATTSSRLRTPAETCALQVGYWVGELLKANNDKGYDYQEMGLTVADYQLVLDITKQAKRLRRTATREQTLAFVATETKRRCASRTATLHDPGRRRLALLTRRRAGRRAGAGCDGRLRYSARRSSTASGRAASSP